MSNKIKSAHSGRGHVPLPAPQWDYANNQKITIGGTSAQSAAINAQLVLLQADVDCFVKIGSNPTAANAQGSRPLAAGVCWAETITPGDKIAVIQSSAGGSLFITPAAEETP